MDAPDYTKYSIDELRDAQAHVDAERFPDRAAEIARQLDSRVEARDDEDEGASIPPEVVFRGVAGLQVIVGVCGLVGIGLGLVTPESPLALTVVGTHWAFQVPPLLVALAAAIAGLLLWARRPYAVPLSQAVWLAQLPTFGLLGLRYTMALCPTVFVWLQGTRLGFDLQWYTYALHYGVDALPYAGVNVVAVACIAVLQTQQSERLGLRRVVEVFR